MSAKFYSPCVAGGTVVTGSCTATFTPYWSSTSYNLDALNAWAVNFNDGRVLAGFKSTDTQPLPLLTEGSLPGTRVGALVRAVRGGL